MAWTLKQLGKNLSRAAKDVVQVAAKAAPILPLVPGIGTIAGIATAGISKLASSAINRVPKVALEPLTSVFDSAMNAKLTGQMLPQDYAADPELWPTGTLPGSSMMGATPVSLSTALVPPGNYQLGPIASSVGKTILQGAASAAVESLIQQGGERVGTSIYDTIDRGLGGLLPGGVEPGGLIGRVLGYGQGGALTGGNGGVLTGNIPVVTSPVQVTVLRAPQGYLLVKGPNGQMYAVLKPVAYALGFRKRPSRRGGISSKDLRSARRVQRLLGEMTIGRRPKGTQLKKKGR